MYSKLSEMNEIKTKSKQKIIFLYTLQVSSMLMHSIWFSLRLLFTKKKKKKPLEESASMKSLHR
jgi:hypothetical protein